MTWTNVVSLVDSWTKERQYVENSYFFVAGWFLSPWFMGDTDWTSTSALSTIWTKIAIVD